MDEMTRQAKLKKREDERRQRELLRKFDADLFTYTGQIAWLLPGIFSFLLLILIAIPVQEFMKDEEPLIWCYMGAIACGVSVAVLWPYLVLSDGFTPQQKNAKISRKLRYLPVSRRQFIYVRIEYLHRYIWKLAVIGLALQCLFALGIEKQIGVVNILYVVIELYVVPMLFGALELLGKVFWN